MFCQGLSVLSPGDLGFGPGSGTIFGNPFTFPLCGTALPLQKQEKDLLGGPQGLLGRWRYAFSASPEGWVSVGLGKWGEERNGQGVGVLRRRACIQWLREEL